MRFLIVSALSIGLLLSLFGNAFFFFERSQKPISVPLNNAGSLHESGATLRQEEQAFGMLRLNLPAQKANPCLAIARGDPATGDECGALASVAKPSSPLPQSLTQGAKKAVAATPLTFAYVATGVILPALPEKLPVYRDAGIAIENESVLKTLERLGAPLKMQHVSLLTDEVHVVTSDNRYSISFSPLTRTLAIKKTESLQAEPKLEENKRVSDSEAVAIATEMVTEFGVHVERLGVPVVLYHAPSSTSKIATMEVLWPLRINDKRVIDRDAQDVPYLSVRIVRSTLQAQDMTMRLYATDTLLVSDYPKASDKTLRSLVQKGGMRPPPDFPNAKRKDVQVTSSELAYLLSEDGGRTLPSYFVPVLLVELALPTTCDGCTPFVWRTYISALAESVVDWIHAS